MRLLETREVSSIDGIRNRMYRGVSASLRRRPERAMPSGDDAACAARRIEKPRGVARGRAPDKPYRAASSASIRVLARLGQSSALPWPMRMADPARNGEIMVASLRLTRGAAGNAKPAPSRREALCCLRRTSVQW